MVVICVVLIQIPWNLADSFLKVYLYLVSYIKKGQRTLWSSVVHVFIACPCAYILTLCNQCGFQWKVFYALFNNSNSIFPMGFIHTQYIHSVNMGWMYI
mgnify:CR=1 FL=1